VRWVPLLGEESVLSDGALDRYSRGPEPFREAAEALDFGELLGGVLSHQAYHAGQTGFFAPSSRQRRRDPVTEYRDSAPQ
jgi:hypothetical protein